MTLRNPRFIHEHRRYRHLNSKYYAKGFNGWTVLMSPSSEHGKVRIQTARCNLKDNFSYAEGRRVAAEKPVQEVAVVDLPKILAQYRMQMWYGKKKVEREDINEYAWVLKYFV